MKLDDEFIQETLNVAFPNHKCILVVAMDTEDQTHGYCMAGPGQHEVLFESANETVITHLEHRRDVDLQKMYKEDEAKYWAILAKFTITAGMNYVSRSIRADSDRDRTARAEKVLSALEAILRLAGIHKTTGANDAEH